MNLTNKSVRELHQILQGAPQHSEHCFEYFWEEENVYVALTVVLKFHQYHHTEIRCENVINLWWISEKEFDKLIEDGKIVHLDEVCDEIQSRGAD